MSSNERNINGNEETESYGIDAVTEMSAEEIERLLAESAGTGSGEQSPGEDIQEDVLDMLEKTENHDDDLSDIQDMLKKSDRKETIDAGDAEEADVQRNPVDKLLADIEGTAEEVEKPMSAKERKALEKQQKAQEKAEKAARKKADKEAAKAEKLRNKRGRDAEEAAEPEKSRKGGTGEIEEFDLLQDKDLLDSIVSDAGKLGGEKRDDDSREGKGFSVNQLGEEYDAARERETLEAERMKEKSVKPEKEDTAESNIMELDMEEIDAFIPDISSEPKEEPKPKQKGGLMTKIISMLMEEEEEPENEDIPLSDENQEILRDLDQEKGAGGKGKKAKKAKKPAKKKEKKKKAPKPAKPPKPKKPKKEPEPYAGKKITFKKALPILLLGATVGAVVFIFVNLAVDFSVKQEAAEAYKNGDYETCYKNLYGKKLSDEQAQMYGKAESILYMEQECRKYDIVMQYGTEVQALDSLLQTVNEYPAVHEYAAQCEALPEVEEIYARIISILFDRYGITEDQAKEIAAIGSSIEYTRAVTAVAEGKGYGAGSTPAVPLQPEDVPEEIPEEVQGEPDNQPDESAEALPDELPEEAGLDDGLFLDD